MRRIEVVAGVIYNTEQSHILIALRPADKHQGNLWEFPGGKKEASESSEQALVRELYEELGITIKTCQPYIELDFDYTDKLVHLDIWQVTEFSGTPVGAEQQEIRWVAVNELPAYTFPEANKPVINRLLSG